MPLILLLITAALAASVCASFDIFSSCIRNSVDKENEERQFSTVLNVITSKAKNSDIERDEPKVCVISRSTQEIEMYSRYSHLIQQLYSVINGFKIFIFHTNTTSLENQDYTYYPKLSLLLSVMQNNDNRCEYVAWMDADFIPMDFSYSITQIILFARDKEIMVSKDVSNIINTGAMIIRNSTWSRRVLSEWLMIRHSPGVINDQTGFDLLYSRYLTASDKSNIAIFDAFIFNSELPAMSRQRSTDKFLHLAAEDDEYRRVVFCIAANHLTNVIITYEDEFMQHLLPQLNATQSTLLHVGVNIYGQVSQMLHGNISAILNGDYETRPNDPNNVLEWLTRYRMVASKYTHAQMFRHFAGKECTETLESRWEMIHTYITTIHSLIVRTSWSKFPMGMMLKTAWNEIMLDWESTIEATSTNIATIATKEIDTELLNYQHTFAILPELLKLMLEVSYEFLMHGEPLTNITTIFHVRIYVLRNMIMPKSLLLLKRLVRTDQQHLVEDMIQDFMQRYQS